jgi:hypothetical protein
MKRIYCALVGLFVITISCNKNDDNNDNPPAANRDWFKLKTLLNSTNYSNGTFYYKDSTEIIIDSPGNKVVFRQYGLKSNGGSGFYKDTSVETYSYDDQNRLVLYEHTDNYDRLFISRMEFVRDANGKVVKVLSGYKNGLMATSEGLVKYDKRGDTTFVTYIDSTRKHPQGYYDAQDYYTVGLVKEKLVYYKYYSLSTPGKLDSTLTTYEYDAAGNLVLEYYKSGTNAPVVYAYERSGEAKELQKFISQWAGDLLWFHRAKLFFFTEYLATVDGFSGNVLRTRKLGSTTLESFTNSFDASGNLNSVSWQTGSLYSTYLNTQNYYYRP